MQRRGSIKHDPETIKDSKFHQGLASSCTLVHVVVQAFSDDSKTYRDPANELWQMTRKKRRQRGPV